MNMSGYGVMTARIGGVSSSLLKSRIVTGDIFGELLGSSYDFTPKVAGGLEYYGSVGPVTGFDGVTQQQHQIFPSIDLNIVSQWEINFGLGVGLTGATDHLIAKMILGYRFNF